jgi:hypothetical protein
MKTAVTAESTQGFITPERRARITEALVRAMVRQEERPLGLFWLERYVELLGLSANASQTAVLERLERLRAFAGASRRTTVEKLDLDWPGDLPKPVYRVWDTGTGLLEIKTLETALRQIRARKP